MRRFLTLAESLNVLDETLSALASYIQHNQWFDQRHAAQVLRDHGYTEVFGGGKYFRAIYHDVTEEDIHRFEVAGDMFSGLKAEMATHCRFDLQKGPQAFTSSLKKAHGFINRNNFSLDQVHRRHLPGDAIEGLQSLMVVYEVEVPADSVLWSMQGLSAFMKTIPDSPAKDALHHSIHDQWDGYASDDEIMIDATRGARILDMHFYNSSSFDNDDDTD